jgi:hypothetical protein
VDGQGGREDGGGRKRREADRAPIFHGDWKCPKIALHLPYDCDNWPTTRPECVPRLIEKFIEFKSSSRSGHYIINVQTKGGAPVRGILRFSRVLEINQGDNKGLNCRAYARLVHGPYAKQSRAAQFSSQPALRAAQAV